MGANPTLAELRQAIDTVDDALLGLLVQRARYARQVAASKQQDASGPDDVVYYRPEREAEVIRRLLQQDHVPLEDGMVRALFIDIMSACRALQRTTRVAYLGPAGSFTHMAAQNGFGRFVDWQACDSIASAFDAVQRGIADHAVVPIENSQEGAVRETLDAFADHPEVRICHELLLPVHHCLLGCGRLDQVRRVLAHPQALAQCRQHLLTLFPDGVEHLASASNARAAQQVTDDPETAAIAGAVAADLYGLQVLAEHMEDDSNNTTRFWVLSKNQRIPATGNDRTSLMLLTKDRPGALSAILKPLAEQGISMTRIESRPRRQRHWAYRFFIDLAGHEEDASMQDALLALRACSEDLAVLGSYPVAQA